MKQLILLFAFLMASAACLQGQITDLPENPEPGECYVKCVTPSEYETKSKQVMIRPEYKILKVVPAEYEWKEEEVVVKEASFRYEITPPEYETVYVDYVEEEGYNKIRITPASFDNDTERIETSPRTVRYEYQTYEDCESDRPGDCQVICAVEYPAQYESVAKEVLANNASFNKSSIEGKSARYAKQVVKKEATYRKIEIPAETKTIRRRVLVKDETIEEEIVPAKYANVETRVLTKAGGITRYEKIDCEMLSYSLLPINYELNSARLTPESRNIIDEYLLKMMRDKPGIRVELAAHTDARGSDSYNMSLSERRAQSVVDYLVSKGISRSRLVPKGYGETRLKNKCANGVTCSEAEHAINRRTEFRVLPE